jgi:signal transduction histidine kinase
MRFSTFILENLDRIVDEWVLFARRLSPAATKMSVPALADHSREILTAIAKDMEIGQDEATRQTKAEGHAPAPLDSPGRTAATAHGALRQLDGFDLDQMVSEFRALRACVLKLWRHAAETVGDRGQAVEEIARFNEGIDQALTESVKQYAKDVAKSRDLFLGVLGHDLRGPLSTIDSSTEILGMPNASPDIKQQELERIRRSSKRMRGLINDLLDYTRTRSGHGLTVSRSTCDLRRICEESIDAVRATNPQQQIATDLVGDLVLQADEKRLEQVLSNLLNNAVQHGVRGALVSLAAHGDANTVFVSVKNLGRPIRRASLPTIFEPLVQGSEAEGETDRARGSIGLGLFIVREIVRGHKGTIDVESSEASGTVFTVRLPRTLP